MLACVEPAKPLCNCIAPRVEVRVSMATPYVCSPDRCPAEVKVDAGSGQRPGAYIRIISELMSCFKQWKPQVETLTCNLHHPPAPARLCASCGARDLAALTRARPPALPLSHTSRERCPFQSSKGTAAQPSPSCVHPPAPANAQALSRHRWLHRFAAVLYQVQAALPLLPGCYSRHGVQDHIGDQQHNRHQSQHKAGHVAIQKR
jgi:hypothetical protein